MLKYCFRRLIQMIPTVIGVILLTFILFNIVPNDLAAIALGKNVTSDKLQAFDERRGLDLPLFVGYYAKTRAYIDHDFKDGLGQWRKYPVDYNDKTKSIRLKDNLIYRPLLFQLNKNFVFVWSGEFKGSGIIGNTSISSEKWKKFKISCSGQDANFFKGDLEFKKLKFRKKLNSPFNSQLTFYIKQLLNGDFGTSANLKQPVTKLLYDGIGPSLLLTVPIFFIGIIVSVSLSLICAFFRNQFIDRFLVILSVALMSINYVVYIVAGQYFLSYKAGIFPIWGFESFKYLILPVLIGVISGLGSNIRFYRAIMLDEMYKDYVRTAIAKGVSRKRVLFIHILKNAMIPIITNVVIAIPFLYTGSLLLENFFGIPGLGYLSINAILSADIDVVRALVLIGSLLFVFSNLLTDICYALVDPRVKLK